MPPKDNIQYLAQQTQCPVCLGDNTEESDILVNDQGRLSMGWDCFDCNHAWVNYYSYLYSEHL